MSELDRKVLGGIPYNLEPLERYFLDENGEQLEMFCVSDVLEEQQELTVRRLGAYFIRRAQQYLNWAELCKDELVDRGSVPHPRYRAIDLGPRELIFGDFS